MPYQLGYAPTTWHMLAKGGADVNPERYLKLDSGYFFTRLRERRSAKAVRVSNRSSLTEARIELALTRLCLRAWVSGLSRSAGAFPIKLFGRKRRRQLFLFGVISPF